MMFSDRITLRSVVNTVDTSGYQVETVTDTAVWADVRSTTRAEFYAANANGIDINQMFAVHVEDWGNQTQVLYSTKTYDIIRAYQKGQGVVELSCSDKAK